MNVVLGLAEDTAIGESLRAVVTSPDFLLLESKLDDGLHRLISSQPDVIVIDDAPALGLRALNAIKAATDTPVVILSGRSDSETIAAYILAGAERCIVKPFECDELAKTLAESARKKARKPAPAVYRSSATFPEGSLSKSQHHAALRWLSRTPDYIDHPARLTQSLVDVLTDVFDTQRAGVLLLSEGEARIASSQGIAASLVASLRFPVTSGLMRAFEEGNTLIDRQHDAHLADALKEMQLIGCRLAVPVVGNGRACGALLVGDKTAGQDYCREERELLSVLARNLATCLEKAKHYRDTSRQHKRLDAVLSNISTGVVTVRPDRTISMINESAERILQLRAVDVLGQSVQKLGSSFADVVMRTLAQSKPRLRETIHDPAIKATLGLSVTPLGSEGVVALFSKIPSDAEDSDRHLLYSPLWEYLSGRLAQEIKNPMVAINTFAQLLPKRFESPEFREEFAQVVQKEVARINGVVETLFTFAKHPRLTLRHSELNSVAARVLKTFDSKFQELSIEVQTKFVPEKLSVNLDVSQFDTALSNVLQNSIDAMADTGGTLKVSTERTNGVCAILISDSGPGISSKDAELIFMPFFSTKEQGMGMGLTIAERILEQHEGDIELINSENGGGAFELHLPADLSRSS